MSFHNRYKLSFVHQDEFNEYSPPETFKMLCEKVLANNATIIFLSSELGSPDNAYTSVSADYLLQMANFLGLPVLVWAEDNSGLVQVNKK